MVLGAILIAAVELAGIEFGQLPHEQIGKSRIQQTSTKTQSGKSFVQYHNSLNQAGVSHITKNSTATQAGKCSVRNTTLKTQAGKTMIGLISAKSQVGHANVRNNTKTTQAGKGSISVHTSKFQNGKSHIAAPIYPWRVKTHQRSSTNFANRVKILGAFNAGVELTSTSNDTASQTALGRIIVVTVPNRQLVTQATCDLAAAIELGKRATQDRLTFEFDQDGLEVGMLVRIDSYNANIHASFVIQSLTMVQKSPTQTFYTAQVGDYQGNLYDRIRQLNRINGPAYLPPVPPGPASITNPMLLPGIVQTLNIAAGAVTTALLQVGAVTSDIIAANAVTTTAIADNAISTPKLQAGSVVAGTIASGAIIAGKIAAGAVVAGTIQAGSITAAQAVFAVGAIQSADIGAAQIQTANIATAAITNAQIANATITSAKIASLNADLITAGTLNANLIAAGAIQGIKLQDGTITAVKISSINASTITTGTLNASLISTGAIQGFQLADGTVSSVKIANLDVTKLNAGTANLVNLNGGTVTLNSNGINTVINNTFNGSSGQFEGLKVTNNATGAWASIGYFNSAAAPGVYLKNSNGQLAAISSNAYILNNSSNNFVMSLATSASGSQPGTFQIGNGTGFGGLGGHGEVIALQGVDGGIVCSYIRVNGVIGASGSIQVSIPGGTATMHFTQGFWTSTTFP